MFYETHVLRTFLHLRKTCVKERTLKHALLDLRAYHVLNVRL